MGGTVAFYGMAGGNLWNVLTSQAERMRRAGEIFGLVRAGQLRVEVARTFPLAEGAAARRFLEGGGSAGKVLLLP